MSRKPTPLERTFGIGEEEARLIERSLTKRNSVRPIAIGLMALIVYGLWVYQGKINDFISRSYEEPRVEYALPR